MHGREGVKDAQVYGYWPWIGGVALAALLIFLMFALAAPIS